MSGWLDAVAASQQGQGIRDLIAAEKVRGTPVFAKDGAQLGVVEELVLDKREGRVAFVLVSAGGFLGLGASLRPAPWALLRFDIRLGGYALGGPADRLKDAPAYDATAGLDEDYARRVEAHYAAGDLP